MNSVQGWRNGIREALHLRRCAAEARPVGNPSLGSRRPLPPHARRSAQYSRHRIRHGHRHRSPHGDRHGAGRRHRRHPPQLRYRRAGGAGAPGEEIRIRHGGEPAHHRARREARRCAEPDEGARHLRHSGGGRRRQRQARQAGRHSHQPRRALCHRSGPEGLRADDEGKARHRARGRQPERSEAAAASASPRKAAGGRRPVSLRRTGHGEGHREGGRLSERQQGRAGAAARRCRNHGRRQRFRAHREADRCRASTWSWSIPRTAIPRGCWKR